jgi:hypothetical protein
MLQIQDNFPLHYAVKGRIEGFQETTLMVKKPVSANTQKQTYITHEDNALYIQRILQFTCSIISQQVDPDH